jgi:hypothetical protein
MYENDPDRMLRPRIGEPAEASSTGVIIGGLVAAALVVLLAFSFWPGDNRSGTAVTQNTPRTERPATPPANKPVIPPAETPAKPTPAQ